MPDITCPTCGTSVYRETLGRDSQSFCPSCDEPLFWAVAPVAVTSASELVATVPDGDGYEHRLPGAGGRVRLATRPCPVCAELNAADRIICIRCGSGMDPVVEIIVEPAPEPIPLEEPREEEPGWWPWILVAILTALLLAVTAWAIWG